MMSAATALFEQAQAAWQAGELAASEAACRAALALQPELFQALNLMGALHGRAGRVEESIACLERAVAVDPGHAGAHSNLANALLLAQRREEAQAALQHALELAPEQASLWHFSAQLQRQLRQPLQALACAERALALQPDRLDSALLRAEVLVQLCDAGMNRKDAALAAYRQAVALGADPAQVDYALAAFGATAAPDLAPRAYVVQLFDSVAVDFDHHLNDTLKYKAPQLLVDALQRSGLRAGASVLDLGCGTGLAGVLLRPQAGRLEGVDLSPAMLEQARRRGIYDALACADIVEHLRALPGPVDLVLAADVFVYLGDLAPVFAASAAALRPGGQFGFTVEALGAGGPDFLLCPTRRYAHALDYVLRLAAEHGFEPALLEAAVLREEGGADVAGGVVVLRRRG